MSKLLASQFKYEQSESYWWRRCLDQDSDIVIPGTDTDPDASALELANSAVAQLDDLIEKTKDYYLAFIDPVKNELKGQPGLVSIACGFTARVVKVSLNYESDVYGLWWVEFRQETILGFTPFSFGRTAW